MGLTRIAHPTRALSARAATVGRRTVLAVEGSVDSANAPVLQRALDAILYSADRDIWLDLTGVTWLGATGLEILRELRRALDRDPRRLAVIAPPGPARDGLRRGGLERELTIYAGARH